MIFQEFFEIKMTKKGFISRGTCAVLTRQKLRKNGARVDNMQS